MCLFVPGLGFYPNEQAAVLRRTTLRSELMAAPA